MKLKRIILSDFMFLIIICLLIILSIFSYERINNLSRQSDWINHTNIIKLKLEQTFSHIRDVEARQRLFLLTNDSAYLPVYLTELKKNEEDLVQLDSLTRDNLVQQRNTKKLQLLTNTRLIGLNAVMDSFAKEPRDFKVLLSEGKSIMDEIERTVGNMRHIEDGLLAERNSKKIMPLI